jgi:uncharacterized integral membrane protein
MDEDKSELPAEDATKKRSVVLVVAGLIVVAVAVFIAQNSEAIPIQFLTFEGSVRLWLLIVVAMTLGAILAWVGAMVLRRRRRIES